MMQLLQLNKLKEKHLIIKLYKRRKKMLQIKKLSIFLIILLLSNNALSDTLPTPTPSPGPQPSLFLHLKDPAPFEGFLITKEKVEEFRDISIEILKDQAI